MPDAAIPTDVGVSARVGGLKSQGPQDDGWHHAAALHMINRLGNFTLASQLAITGSGSMSTCLPTGG